MAAVTTESIRNVVLIGNTGTGKTQLAEAMLHKAGVINRLGTPDEGNTVSDFEPEEKERGSSITTSIMHLTHKGVHVNLLDTPGYSDFIGAALRGLSATDAAVLVVGAATGVDIHSRRLFNVASEAGLARFVVVNKADAENIDLASLVGQIQEGLGPQCRPLTIPVGQGADFKSVVDAFATAASADGLMDVAAAHGELVESIIEADESLMERYLGDETISEEELAAAFTKALTSGTLIPILFTSARQEIGVEELLDHLVQSAPNPRQAVARTARKGTAEDAEEVTLEADPNAPFCAQVFKIVSDPFVGKIAFLRVYRGRLEADSSARINDERRETKFSQLLRSQGKENHPIEAAVAGDIVGAPKVEGLKIGDTVTTGPDALIMPPIRVPVPMFALALQPKSRGDEQKISESLSKMLDEDSTLKTTRDRQTNELVVNGLGDIHLMVLLERMKRRYQVDVDTKPPKIPYRETITSKAEGHYRHKKQTGGAGQFGEVYLRVEPLGRDEGFEFVDAIFGGSIPRQFLPAIEKGVREAMEEGVVAGCPFQDARVSVYDGKHHAVDSKEVAFKIAGRNAFRDAVQKAKPAILEPHVNMAITVPDEFLGSITGDLNSRRGRIMGMQAGPGGTQTITVQVPLAEVAQYNTQLRSITGGQGSYTMEFSHYEAVPANVQQQIIEHAAKAKQEEE
ncbi:MAG: elongation factor G [Planctomycetes bacterium]|nr:elongation factor G [Planctomycetota bacterium]